MIGNNELRHRKTILSQLWCNGALRIFFFSSLLFSLHTSCAIKKDFFLLLVAYARYCHYKVFFLNLWNLFSDFYKLLILLFCSSYFCAGFIVVIITILVWKSAIKFFSSSTRFFSIKWIFFYFFIFYGRNCG